MGFTAIQYLFVIICSVVVMGRNSSDESELKCPIEAMETGNFTQECDVTLDLYIELSCCQERQNEDYGSGCFHFKACNEKNHCQFTDWFYPAVVLICMLAVLILCCPVTSAIGRFCFKHLRKLFGGLCSGRVGGSDASSDANFEMKSISKSPNNSVEVTEVPSDDNIEEHETSKEEVESQIEHETPKEVQSQIEVQIHSSHHPFAVEHQV